MEDRVDAEEPITISEAYQILSQIKNRYKNPHSEAYKFYMSTLEYTERFGRIKEPAMIEILKNELEALGYSKEEVVALGNLLPESGDEARICIPSISKYSNQKVEEAISKVHNIQ